MKLSEYKDEQALDLLADLIEPATEIIGDANVKNAVESGQKAKAVAVAIKNHKKAVIAILAALDGVPADEYHCTVLTIPLKLIELFDDPDVVRLFSSAGQKEAPKPYGSHTENIEDGEQ